MHGRPRPKNGLPVDPDKEHAKKQKARSTYISCPTLL